MTRSSSFSPTVLPTQANVCSHTQAKFLRSKSKVNWFLPRRSRWENRFLEIRWRKKKPFKTFPKSKTMCVSHVDLCAATGSRSSLYCIITKQAEYFVSSNSTLSAHVLAMSHDATKLKYTWTFFAGILKVALITRYTITNLRDDDETQTFFRFPSQLHTSCLAFFVYIFASIQFCSSPNIYSLSRSKAQSDQQAATTFSRARIHNIFYLWSESQFIKSHFNLRWVGSVEFVSFFFREKLLLLTKRIFS